MIFDLFDFFLNSRFYLDKYREIGSLSSVRFSVVLSTSILHTLHTHIHTQAIPACTLELVELEIRLHGGVIAEQFNEDITHVVFDKQ